MTMSLVLSEPHQENIGSGLPLGFLCSSGQSPRLLINSTSGSLTLRVSDSINASVNILKSTCWPWVRRYTYTTDQLSVHLHVNCVKKKYQISLFVFCYTSFTVVWQILKLPVNVCKRIQQPMATQFWKKITRIFFSQKIWSIMAECICTYA